MKKEYLYAGFLILVAWGIYYVLMYWLQSHYYYMGEMFNLFNVLVMFVIGLLFLGVGLIYPSKPDKVP